MKWVLRAVFAAALVLGGWWLWQRVFVSDETRVRRLLAGMVSAVEKPNFVQLTDAIASDYGDDYGLDKSQVIGYVRAFRQQYDAVFIHLSDLTVSVEPDHKKGQAVFVSKILATPKGGVTETEVRADRFRLYFRKTDDGWKLYRVESPELKFE